MSFLWFLSALFPVRRVLAQAIIRKIYINYIYGNYICRCHAGESGCIAGDIGEYC